jgi:hypothetical protein
MTPINDFELNLPWDFDAPPVPPSQQFRPLEEYIDFLEDIDALRSPGREIEASEEPFTL